MGTTNLSLPVTCLVGLFLLWLVRLVILWCIGKHPLKVEGPIQLRDCYDVHEFARLLRYLFLLRISLSRSSDSLCWSQCRSLKDWCKVWIYREQPQIDTQYKTLDTSKEKSWLSLSLQRCTFVETTVEGINHKMIWNSWTHCNPLYQHEQYLI